MVKCKVFDLRLKYSRFGQALIWMLGQCMRLVNYLCQGMRINQEVVTNEY